MFVQIVVKTTPININDLYAEITKRIQNKSFSRKRHKDDSEFLLSRPPIFAEKIGSANTEKINKPQFPFQITMLLGE
ncbi:hypothetical protein HMPREF0765_4914 [Sphingobacterium spiritivorum ATCC 33300]|uniref:Uncharacterized protein n=1 Tax=Sphingobacterium spiritivorum ATCC 33300 TaxID=525372 RepID=C2G5Q8_SPHSI|nr:hypothetical protein HMPREF0765_4914 [Sphingobacterium spiritivorum ATCC 33300]